MNENQTEDVYLTLLGQLMNSPWNDITPNLYAAGSTCDKLYGEVYDMKIRLSERLGVPDEDEDA